MAPTILRTGVAASVFWLLAACVSSMPGAGFPKQESHAFPPSAPGGMDGVFEKAASSNERGSGFHMLSAGLDGLLARVELIDSSRRSLDLQYYIFRGDESGLIVAAALLRAADRGVRVRVVLDDGETVAGDEKIAALSAQQGIEVRVFNPLRYRGHNPVARGAEFLFNKNRLDYRMHNKLLVADNAVALVGGRNIGDQYFQLDPDSQFGDDDVVTVGPIVQQLSGVFDEFWNSTEVIPAQAVDRANTTALALANLRSVIAAQGPAPHESRDVFLARLAAGEPLNAVDSDKTPLSWAPVRLVHDSPDKKQVTAGSAAGSLIYTTVAAEAKTVDDEMIMVTPYLVPTPAEAQLLAGLRKHNARVRVLTNSLVSTPSSAAQAGYMHYRPILLKEGVELYEIRALLGSTRGTGQGKSISRHGNYGLHAKLYVFDRKAMFVGSMNFDQRSKRLNTEIGLVIYSAALARQTAVRFDALVQPDNAYHVELSDAGRDDRALLWKTRESGADKIYTTEPARSAWQRFKVKVLSWLPLDREL